MQKTAPIHIADHEEIALLAYHLWETEGKPSGKADEFWLRAEKTLLSTYKPHPRGTIHPSPETRRLREQPALAEVPGL